jgi:hypothetical protein
MATAALPIDGHLSFDWMCSVGDVLFVGRVVVVVVVVVEVEVGWVVVVVTTVVVVMLIAPVDDVATAGVGATTSEARRPLNAIAKRGMLPMRKTRVRLNMSILRSRVKKSGRELRWFDT